MLLGISEIKFELMLSYFVSSTVFDAACLGIAIAFDNHPAYSAISKNVKISASKRYPSDKLIRIKDVGSDFFEPVVFSDNNVTISERISLVLLRFVSASKRAAASCGSVIFTSIRSSLMSNMAISFLASFLSLDDSILQIKRCRSFILSVRRTCFPRHTKNLWH